MRWSRGIRNRGRESGFSDSLFFPDCGVVLGGDIYLRDGRLTDGRIPLLVDRDQLLADLLAHPEDTFAFQGCINDVAATWEQVGSAQVQNYLWYALENWFSTLSHRVEFEVTMNLGHLAESADIPGYSCYVRSSSERIELTSRSVEWGRKPAGEN